MQEEIRKQFSSENVFYVYVYFNPLVTGKWVINGVTYEQEPFYVGKGKKNRKLFHLRDKYISHKTNTIRKIRKNGLEPIIEVICQGLTEYAALQLETDTIKELGTRSEIEGVARGPLTNQMLSHICSNLLSEETKQKISAAHKAGKYRVGKPLSNETKAKMSAARIGKTQSAETKTKRAKTLTGQKRSEEHSQKMSKILKGKKFSDGAKRNMSEAAKNRSEEARKRMSVAQKSKQRKIPYTILTESGEKITTHQMKRWCTDNGVKYTTLLKTKYTGKFYQGFRLLP